MTDKQTAALKLALEALEDCYSTGDYNEYQFYDEDLVNAAKKALREALEQPNIAKYLEKDNSEQPAQQQEPVAWMASDDSSAIEISPPHAELIHQWIPLYTSPQPAQPSKPLTDDVIEADMFWNYDDAETPHKSVEEFLNNEICNGYLEVGAVFTLLRAKRLPNIKIKVTNIDDNESEAEYEIIEAAHIKGDA